MTDTQVRFINANTERVIVLDQVGSFDSKTMAGVVVSDSEGIEQRGHEVRLSLDVWFAQVI